MISVPDLISLVQEKLPNAEVNVLDKTGMMDHFIIHVTASQFETICYFDNNE